MQKILVLGGVGAIANETTRDLVQTSQFDEIVVADIDLDKVETLCQELKDPRLKAVQINADNISEMANLMKEFTVVASGLPRTFGFKAIKAAIEAKVHIIDLISPHEETLSLDNEARNSGIAAVGGVGITPGLTNVLAQIGAENLDNVEQIDIDFAAFRSIAHSPGLLHVILWEFDSQTTNRYSYEQGRLTPHPPFSGARTVCFPEPIGAQTTYYVPHGETQTLSKNIPGVKNVFIRGCFPPKAMRLVQTLHDYGLYTSQPISFNGTEIQPVEFIKNYLLTAPEGDNEDIWAYSIQVEVTGLLKGYKVCSRLVSQHPPMEQWGGRRAYSKNVGIPLSIGAQLLANGKAKKYGMDGVETMLPANEFINELRKRDFAINTTLNYLV